MKPALLKRVGTTRPSTLPYSSRLADSIQLSLTTGRAAEIDASILGRPISRLFLGFLTSLSLQINGRQNPT
jgi:hypothetical protein